MIVRIVILAAAMSLSACAQAEPSDAPPMQDVEGSPAEVLAAQLHQAVESGDHEAFNALVKLDGADEIVRSAFERLSGGILGRQVNSVTLEPAADTLAPYEYDGVTYSLNGEAVGEVKIDFAMDNPSESETFSMAYAIEGGRAVLLLAVPPPAEE